MPSRQMGMCVGARHAREQSVHQDCMEGPDSSPETLKGQSVQIIASWGKSSLFQFSPALIMKMQKCLSKPF